MNREKIWAIARKDLQEASQNQSVWMPMLIVPLIFIVILPLAMILIPTQMDISPQVMASESDLQAFLSNMPAGMTVYLEGLTDMQRMLVIMLGFFFAPMFLILPLMFATTIAAESFAGERERKTMEALLYSGASDGELFSGKVLAAALPAVGISWISFLVYILVLNGAGWPVFGRIWFPLSTWWPLIFWLTPALAVFGLSITVLISTRVQTFMGAYQTSASTVVLVLGLLVGQLTGALYLSVAAGFAIGAVLWAIDAALLFFAVRAFNRSALLAH